ncbi:hypothetical protein C8R47DRAFT_1202082 [Mycena vitilis]|nr:hypothetical protein C8R47DRAFT_1202082 [Mycena vitilis]
MELAEDVRFVSMVSDDWVMGALAGVDYWTRAEDFIAKRRSGEINSLEYFVDGEDISETDGESRNNLCFLTVSPILKYWTWKNSVPEIKLEWEEQRLHAMFGAREWAAAEGTGWEAILTVTALKEGHEDCWEID